MAEWRNGVCRAEEIAGARADMGRRTVRLPLCGRHVRVCQGERGVQPHTRHGVASGKVLCA
eukprot:2805018-Pyramimonas_sp.AAC.2